MYFYNVNKNEINFLNLNSFNIQSNNCNSNNTGLYIISKFNEQFTSNEIKSGSEIQDIFLKNSDSIEKTCLLCNVNKHELNTVVKWVQCESCFRWIHITCLNLKQEVNLEAIQFKCELCLSYMPKRFNLENVYNSLNKTSAPVIIGVLNSSEFNHCQIKQLEFEDFNTLSVHKNEKHMWLSNFIIDFCTGLIAGSNINYTIINCNISSIILTSSKENVDHRIIPHLKNTIIMPLNVKGIHWILAIADLNKKTFTLLDSFVTEEKKDIKYLKHFLNKIEIYNEFNDIKIETNGWQCKKIRHAKQKDSFNCGVFILLYLRNIIYSKKLSKLEDPMAFREFLKESLLKKCSEYSSK